MDVEVLAERKTKKKFVITKERGSEFSDFKAAIFFVN